MPDRISLTAALDALKNARTDDEIVITLMGTAREWLKMGPQPLDFLLVPSSMGQGTSLGLGLALSQPERNVIVCNGDGSMLMNLGSLVTITSQAPPNLTVLAFDNGAYEVTGGQATPGAAPVRADGRDVDFAEMARACGFSSVHVLDDLETWQRSVRQIIDEPGPTFVWLKITADSHAGGPGFPGPCPKRAADFRAALQDQ